MPKILLSRNYSRTIKSLSLLFLFSALFFLLLWSINSILKIRRIVIEGYKNETPLLGLSSYYQRNLLLTSSKDLEKTILEENPQLRSVSVQKVFPNSLILTIEIQPITAILEMSEGYGLLSSEGKILQKSRQQEPGFPLIRYYQKLNYLAYSTGDNITYIDLSTALHFINRLKDLGLRTDTVDINGVDMLLFTIGAKKIFFTTEKSKETQDYELEQIIRQFKIEGKDFSNLDLRFEKPVVQF